MCSISAGVWPITNEYLTSILGKFDGGHPVDHFDEEQGSHEEDAAAKEGDDQEEIETDEAT